MLRDWEATSGFVEVRSKNMVTWNLMFAQMDHNTLYFYEDESEKKALFAVQFNQGYSVEALSSGFQFEIRNNNLEEIRTPVNEGEQEEEDTPDSESSLMAAGKSFLKRFGRQIFASGNTLTISVADAGNLEMWMITIIQAIQGTVRQSERFEGRLSVVDTVGRALSGDQPSAALMNLRRETADHLVSGILKKSTPVPITQAALKALSKMGVSEGDTSTPQSMSAPPSIWEDMWCELRCEPSGVECTFSCYRWSDVMSRFRRLKGGNPDIARDAEEISRMRNTHSSSASAPPAPQDSADGAPMPPAAPESTAVTESFPHLPWVSPHGFSGSDKSGTAWTDYRCLWSTVEGYDASAEKPRPIPRPPGDATVASIQIKATTSVLLLPPSLGERYSFAVVNSAEGGIRIAAPTEEAQIAWIGHLEEAIMSAKVSSKPLAAQQRRRSSSGSGLVRAAGEASVAATISATEDASKDIIPMKRLSGVNAGRRSFTGNFDGVVQEAVKEVDETTIEDEKDGAGAAAGEECTAGRKNEERKFIPRSSLRMSLAKASGRRSSINIGKIEISTTKIDAMSSDKKVKEANFAEVIGNKSDGKSNGRAVRRDYSSAAGVIRRASTAGGASIPQRHLPKFKAATVIAAGVGDQEGSSMDSPTGALAKGQYVSPAERERLKKEAEKEKEAAIKREMERAAEIKRKAQAEKEARARQLAEQQERNNMAEAAMTQDETHEGSIQKVQPGAVSMPVGTFDNDSEGDDEEDDDETDTQPTSFVRRLSSGISGAVSSDTKTKTVADTGSWTLFGPGKTTSVIGKDIEDDHLYYTTYFCTEAPQSEDGPLVEEGEELLVSVWQNQRFVPLVGFSRQNLFLVRDPPALSDVTGHLRFPSVSLEYASPPSGYKWADTEDGRNWCISDDRVDVLEMERELTGEEKREKALAESLEAGLETASKVKFSAAGEDDELSSDDSSGDEAAAKSRKKGPKRDSKSWSGDIRDWEEGWVYAHAFHRFAVHRKTKAYHFLPGIKDTVRRRRIERRCVKIG